jgi:hypothetical protein
MDWYEQERVARFATEVRPQVEALRAGGEPDSVVFYVEAAPGHCQDLLEELGWPDVTPGDRSPVLVLPGPRVAQLLDHHVSTGLGTRVLVVPIQPEHAFRLMMLSPDRLDIHVLVFEGKDPQRVASFFLDLQTRVLTLNTDGDKWDTMQIDW